MEVFFVSSVFVIPFSYECLNIRGYFRKCNEYVKGQLDKVIHNIVMLCRHFITQIQ